MPKIIIRIATMLFFIFSVVLGDFYFLTTKLTAKNDIYSKDKYGDQGSSYDVYQEWHRLNDRVNSAYRHGDHDELNSSAKKAYEFAVSNFGKNSYEASVSLNSIAAAHQVSGRYGEAERKYIQARKCFERVVDVKHIETIKSMNNLATLYKIQGRYDEAEPLFKETLELIRQLDSYGPEHPDTLSIQDNLAMMYRSQKQYREAEVNYDFVLLKRREILGPDHRQTLSSMNNLALLYQYQGRYDKAEPLYQEALELMKVRLGLDHPTTLACNNNLALLYHFQGELNNAEKQFNITLDLYKKKYGAQHPRTLQVHLNFARLLVAMGKVRAANLELRRIGNQLFQWTVDELYSTQKARVRRQLLLSRADFQDIVLSLAILHPMPDTIRLATEIVLRWKRVQGEEEAYIENLVRRSKNESVVKLGKKLEGLRSQLAYLFNTGKPFEDTLSEMETTRLELARLSRDYSVLHKSRKVDLNQLVNSIPPDSALIELKQFRMVDFNRRKKSDWHWAAILVKPNDRNPVILDLGPSADYRKWLQIAKTEQGRGVIIFEGALENKDGGYEESGWAEQIYRMLFLPFEKEIAGLKTVYLAPDGALHLIPFQCLVLADKRYWIQRQMIRILQSGRDLIKKPYASPSNQLLAFGDIDFGNLTSPANSGQSETHAGYNFTHTVLSEFFHGFNHLIASREEVIEISKLYRNKYGADSVRVLMSTEARETFLKKVTVAPRVLHLATHGFYYDGKIGVERPMLLSGLAMADANVGLSKGGIQDKDDGILYALEAIGLFLRGTELVVLSACRTGEGTVDYSDGVYGLVRAFQLAGANAVLMTLWPIEDEQAKDFMIAFYQRLLMHPDSNVYTALRQTQLVYINHPDKNLRKPVVWAPYVLVGHQ